MLHILYFPYIIALYETNTLDINIIVKYRNVTIGVIMHGKNIFMVKVLSKFINMLEQNICRRTKDILLHSTIAFFRKSTICYVILIVISLISRQFKIISVY